MLILDRIIEENHYYAYGLRIEGISSKKFGDDNYEGELLNHYLYNDKELFEDGDLNWYDYGFRNYDPQIGRFPQLDPLTWDYPELTNYQYASNDPIANVDMDGLESLNVIGYVGDAVVTEASFLSEIILTLPKVVKAGATISKVANILDITAKAVDVVTDFIPIVSGSKDIYNGISNGNWWQAGLGVISIAVDVFTFGGSSVAKGIAETSVKEGVEILIKKETKQIVKKEVIGVSEKNLSL